MKITVLPLDSRPCTYDFPRQLAEGCGVQAVLPPREMMDFYTEPSQHNRIAGWLEKECPSSRVVILSVDQLVYGGLLASRTNTLGEDQALDRLNLIKTLKMKNPGVRICLFNVIMRTTVSTLREEDRIWWQKVAEYSKAAAQGENNHAEQKRAQELSREIPREVLNTFLSVRHRNHQINCAALELVSQGFAEELVLLQEDSAPAGLHKVEQQNLLTLAAQNGIEDKVHLHCGTDEIVAALVGRETARYLGEGATPGIYVEWLDGEQPQFTALYEDRPFVQNLEAYLATCRIQAEVSPEKSDIVMLIYAPKGVQVDTIDTVNAVCTYSNEELEGFARRAAWWLKQGKQVALLDIHYANGGDGKLIGCFAREGVLHRLCGYSAWNTASNSLGTLLGQLQTLPYAQGDANLAFTEERLLDDWLYQSVVRQRFNAALRQMGEDAWNIKDIPSAENLLRQMMRQAPERRRILPGIMEDVRLYWPRTFEAEITSGRRDR